MYVCRISGSKEANLERRSISPKGEGGGSTRGAWRAAVAACCTDIAGAAAD